MCLFHGNISLYLALYSKHAAKLFKPRIVIFVLYQFTVVIFQNFFIMYFCPWVFKQ